VRYVSAQPIALVSLHFVTLVLCNVTLHNCVCKTELFRKTPFSRGHSCTALQLDLLQAVFLMAADSYPNFFANCTLQAVPTLCMLYTIYYVLFSNCKVLQMTCFLPCSANSPAVIQTSLQTAHSCSCLQEPWGTMGCVFVRMHVFLKCKFHSLTRFLTYCIPAAHQSPQNYGWRVRRRGGWGRADNAGLRNSLWHTKHGGSAFVFTYVGLARTVYIRRIWPYVWWFPCQKYRMYTVYIGFWPTLHICIYVRMRCR